MRTCAYYPVKVYSRTEEDVSEDIPDGFEDDFFDSLTYDGEVNEEQSFFKSIDIPTTPEISKELIKSRIEDIRDTIAGKEIGTEDFSDCCYDDDDWDDEDDY